MTKLSRGHVAYAAPFLAGFVLLAKLFVLQVLGEEYRLAAEKNVVRPILAYPYRGVISDRHGSLLAHNVPIYDLMVIPGEVKNPDVLSFCRDFGIAPQTFEKAFKKAKDYSHSRPSVFVRGISQEVWAEIQDFLADYPGFFVQVRTTRKYPFPILANVLGYIGEIGPQQLASDTAHLYKQGDVVGIGGLEKSYEEVLKGCLGVQYKIKDARGVTRGSFRDGYLDLPPTPGQDLETTLDASLQLYGEQLMRNKRGSIVVLVPQTGEVLALVSSPSYDPNLLTGSELSVHFASLEQDSSSPLFHRAIAATYPPGSIFKLAQALIALQEGLLSEDTVYPCDKKLVKCHPHPACLSLKQAIKHSCNPYFCRVFRQLVGSELPSNNYETRKKLEKWHGYLGRLGFGKLLGIDLPGEKNGLIPDVQFYDRLHGERGWRLSTIRSLDIGQGELLVTPLQMANFAVTLANRGYYYIPYVVKRVGGQSVTLERSLSKCETAVDRVHFEYLARAMREGVEGGTSFRARIDGLSVCAKTGTAENPHGNAHSICIAFAPEDDPQVALSVCVENAGWGSRAAASIAGLMIEKYLKGVIDRPMIQEYVLKGNFFH